MSGKLFDRTASLVVSLAGQTTGINLSGLRIEFEIKKTSEKTPNEAIVKVYNLSEDTRNQISSVETPRLFLSAGYTQDSGEETLFIGDITNIKHEDQPPERITTFECDDGEIALKDSRLSISRVAGASAKSVLSELINAFKNKGVALKYLDPTITDQYFANGFSAVGTTSDILDMIADRLGAEWSIQANQLKVVKQGQTDGLTVVKISPSTGMIGSPERISFTALKKKSGLKTVEGDTRNAKKQGWKVRTLLRPIVEPQSKVIVESKEISNTEGAFRVETVTHTGDTHGDPWFTEIEVVTL